MVWQRSLFSIYGSNIEAVSIVVTAFMLVLPLIRIWRRRAVQRRALADV